MSKEGLELEELDLEQPETGAYLRQWDKSGLIEDAKVYDQNKFQEQDFDRDNTGELEKKELVSRESHEEALEEAVREAQARERRRILDNLQTELYQLDWIKILQKAIESRPTSWGYPDRKVETENGFDHPVIEWRNASDELIRPIWKQLEEELEEEVEQ